MNSLVSSTRLNWWVEMGICRKLWPLATTGDGNCLLHAASLGMWGFHDRRLTLRKALHNILSEGECRDALWRRWRFHQTRVNKEAGLVFSETEWAKEWEELVGIASPEPRHNKNANSARRRSVVLEKSLSLTCVDSIDGNAVYESLEEIHVLALAYVLRRPIIVISDIVLMDINGEALAPINFGGVYLPYDISPNDCHRVPLLLAYDTAHFSALVTMETQNDFPAALIPLTDFENILLPIQFGIDPGCDFNWREYDGREGNWALSEVEHIALLKEYLEIVYASPVGSPEDEMYEDYQSEEEYDKKIIDLAININNEENHSPGNDNAVNSQQNNNLNSNKSKSAKLQSVAKQFGSIGRNMSKKIKKNIGSITKLGGRINQNSTNKLNSNASTIATLGGGFVNGKFRLLCAQLKAKRHDYQEEMIKNYLDCAQERFLKQMRNAAVDKTGKVSSADVVDSVSVSGATVAHCINSGCENFGTEKNSWLCHSCYDRQKQRESSNQDYTYQAPRYGTGNSKFYTQSDTESHDVIKRLPSVKRLNEVDQTLYLSKSTFFNDLKPQHNILGLPVTSPTSISPTPFESGSSYSINMTGRTTIIPMNIEGRENDENLIQLHPDSTTSISNDNITSININSSAKANNLNSSNLLSNGLINSRCVVSLPPAPISPREHKVNGTLPALKNGSFNFNLASSLPVVNDRTSYSSTECRTRGCSFYGSQKTNYYCSKCCQEQQSQLHSTYRKLQTDI